MASQLSPVVKPIKLQALSVPLLPRSFSLLQVGIICSILGRLNPTNQEEGQVIENLFFALSLRESLRPDYALLLSLCSFLPCTLRNVPVCVSVPAHRWVQLVPFA